MKYQYTLQNFNLNILDDEILNSSLGSNFEGLSAIVNEVTVYMSSSLSAPDKAILDTLVSDHSTNVVSTDEYAFETTADEQFENIGFGQSLIQDWMRMNKVQGISIEQSLWAFSRFEETQVIFAAGTKSIDIFKLLNSGAIETAYYAMLQIQPDDMLQSYHWITQARIDWVKSKIEDYLPLAVTQGLQQLSNSYTSP